jgi:hypothetical protein
MLLKWSLDKVYSNDLASHDLDVYAIGFPKVTIENIKKKLDKENISIKLRKFHPRLGIVFGNKDFDTVYLQMLI